MPQQVKLALAVGIYIIGTVVARLLAGRFISILGCRKML